jgi:ribulose-5-phosphate 4-epimerase/fuculose-1-phosphate aldolase
MTGDLSQNSREQIVSEELDAKQQQLKQQIVAVTNELFDQDIVTASGGNISARIPEMDTIWITPTKLFKGGLTVDDLIRVDLDGNVLEGRTRPSIEAPLHTGIYRERSDVLAVVHSHAPYGTAIGLCNYCMPPITFGGFIISKMPFVPYTPSGGDLAKAVLEVLGEWPGVFLQNHGLLTVGKDLRSATNFTEMVEHTGRVLLIAKLLSDGGPLKTLPAPLLKLLEHRAADIAKMMA